MNLRSRMILDEYRISRDNYLKLGDIVHNMLVKLAEDANIPIMAIEHRVKTEESLAGKLELKGDHYQKLGDITDILGTRIITYFSDDVDKIGDLVEDAFEIDRENSQDKRKLLDNKSFGYLSLHYICSLKESEGYPEELNSIRFEIQIRTNLQHTWAQIEHDMGYKSDFGVPNSVVRSFSRIAGLLELADSEFVRTRDAVNEYTEAIRQKIVRDEADDLPINIITINEYVKNRTHMQQFLQEIATKTNAEIKEVAADSYVEQLHWLGIYTIGELKELLAKYHDRSIETLDKVFDDAELDMVSSNVGLRFLCRGALEDRNYTEDQLTDYFMLTFDDVNRARKMAQYLIRSKESGKDDKDGNS